MIIAEQRAKRPQPARIAAPPGSSADCPFCIGHESATPPPVLVLPEDGKTWQVRVVPNKYPALTPGEAVRWPAEIGPGEELPGLGQHEVIVDSPRHVERVTDLSADALRQVLTAMARRIAAHYEDPAVEYVQAFKNVGPTSGATIAHAHSQIVALPLVPPRVAARLERCQRHHDERQLCAVCHEIAAELSTAERIVHRDNDFLSYCPHASRTPGELWIAPLTHAARFELAAERLLASLAATMLDACRRIDVVLDRPDYNLVLQTSPRRLTDDATYHWHWELIPRVTQLAGFEWGGGCYINTLSPERAAEALRSVKV